MPLSTYPKEACCLHELSLGLGCISMFTYLMHKIKRHSFANTLFNYALIFNLIVLSCIWFSPFSNITCANSFNFTLKRDLISIGVKNREFDSSCVGSELTYIPSWWNKKATFAVQKGCFFSFYYLFSLYNCKRNWKKWTGNYKNNLKRI